MAEFEQSWARARTLIKEKGLDALCLTERLTD
jgi:hypothetical protein